MRSFVIACVAALSLAGCTAPTATTGGGAPASISDQITLKATTALSLGELAYNSAEATATAVLKGSISGKHLSADDASKLGAYVHQARAYRDQARSLVAAGGDASAVLESLNDAIANINALTGNTSGG